METPIAQKEGREEKMKNDNEVHLSFKTDRKTSDTLKLFAHSMGKTQPELIEEICKDFIKMIETAIKEEMKENN